MGPADFFEWFGDKCMPTVAGGGANFYEAQRVYTGELSAKLIERAVFQKFPVRSREFFRFSY